MPYKKPMKGKGKSERPFAHAVKLCWFLVQFEDPYHKITLKKFCEEFEEIIKQRQIIEILGGEYGIEWTFYNDDGSLCKPNYETARKTWSPNYNWREQYRIFKSDRLMNTEDSEREKYLRHISKMNQHDFNLLNRCYAKEQEYTDTEENGGKDMTYYRNKNNDTISNIDERLRKRNGFDKTKVELNGDLKADVDSKVSINDATNTQVKDFIDKLK